MPLLVGRTSRDVPNLASNNTNLDTRVSQYGDLRVSQCMDNHSSLADEGLYFKAFNPSFGTGVTMTAQTGFLATSAFLVLQTADVRPARVCLDYIRLMCTAAGNSATTFNVAMVVDQNRTLSTAGTAITPVNVSPFTARNNSYLQISAGANTLAAASPSARTLHRQVLKTASAPTLVVGDLFSFDFGEHSQQLFNSNNSLTAAAYSFASGPVVLGSGDTFSLHLWGNSLAGSPAFEFEMGWWER